MKKIILSAAVAFTVLTTSNVVAQQGFGTNTPDRSAAVDIVSSKRGLLIPRIDIPNLDQAAPVANPANALMVYNTGSTTAAGFYYWDATYNNNAGRWVRFVSSNSGSAVTVSAGTNVTVKPTTDGRDTDYNVSVKGGAEAGQVLVTKIVEIDGETVHTTEWVKPEDFIQGSVVGVNGVTAEIVGDKVQVGLGGALGKATTIETTAGDKGNTLAITGLEKLDGTAGKEFDATAQNIVIMGADGILKVVTPKALLEDVITEGVNGKALTSSSITVDTNGATALLKDVNIEITPGGAGGMVLVTKDDNGTKTTEWVTPESLGNTVTASNGLTKDANNDIALGGALSKATTITTDETNTLALDGLKEQDKAGVAGKNVVLADSKGVLSETTPANLIGQAIEDGGIDAKTLKGDGITVTAGSTVGTSLEVASALLKDVTLGIANGAVTNEKIDAGAVTADKMTSKDAASGDNAGAGKVPVADGQGGVTYQNVSTAIGKDLTTDGKIVIGTNKDSQLEDAVLVPTHLSIKEGSITTDEIADGTIANIDLGSQVVSADKMTSNTTANGTATPAGEGQIPVADGNGGVTYQQITGDVLNGKELKSTSIKVTGGEKALLDETTIEIAGGTAAGQVLVTKEVTVGGTTTYVTEWVTPNDLGNTVTASNGLTKTDNDIALGGTIDKGTTLAIAPGTSNPDGTVTGGGSLAITGLKTADSKQGNKTVVVQANGQLATIDTAAGNVTINQGGDVNISDNSVVNNYHPSMSEIVIEVTLGATDTNLSLPAVNGTEGQTISVKIVNTDEDHNGYLNIKSGSNVLAYGAMPHQGWIIKSNGTKWIVVGRN
ncbi:hypothetical protein [Myroides odoratus]|uniref:Uncharacterized protein n=1 Tax=Myroides odoratus TaxID=256 RepID=A0A9Q7E7S5_MYROD|nr:hypothetical protein [Myroides odoratus]EHQ41459.1 hypothetical protein Myrod_0623 [Myroides odoratus DSM 2801]EKB08671.1 hypothetical protein HMPREF9716_00722 [Myroides odoratus CIP 103059]QQT98892.1 hypothetical protein I6I88_11765 [Myroides odoratus]WQD58924.1 hypothetical protein U0010_07210 [Myroides odoratus]STZ28726.1 Uncharacterised protein [Myroides odoratus]